MQQTDSTIRNLLDFSRFKDLELRLDDVNDVVESSLALARSALFQLTVVKELATDVPQITLDRQKIEQVLVNLFLNASHATPTGGTLTVRTYLQRMTEEDCEAGRTPGRFKPGEQAVVVEVDDTGAGILSEHLPKIFTPFFTTKPEGKGTGLGLTVTQKIIDLHRGTIDINNRQPCGVRVTLRLKAQ